MSDQFDLKLDRKTVIAIMARYIAAHALHEVFGDIQAKTRSGLPRGVTAPVEFIEEQRQFIFFNAFSKIRYLDM